MTTGIYARAIDRVVPGSTRGEPPPSAWGRALELGYTHKSRRHAYSQLKGVAHSHDGSVALGILHSAVGEEIARALEGIAQRCLLIYLGRTLFRPQKQFAVTLQYHGTPLPDTEVVGLGGLIPLAQQLFGLSRYT